MASLQIVLQTLLAAAPGQAQSITAQPANEAGATGTAINVNGREYTITGGVENAGNLFHSLQQFGLSPSEIATFVSNPNIQNILTRIVGGDVSIIEGLIQVTGGNSNLFLLNPAGVVFSDQAQLNVPASFHVTTANAINFGDRLFNAFGANDYSLLVDSPTAYTFTNESTGSIINQADLAVNSGQTLSL
ncbi:MAG: filamentous hemagglutinin N-terminal domain-containing protein, partial [Cyanobacteria bacterium P01_H01_bin.121]